MSSLEHVPHKTGVHSKSDAPPSSPPQRTGQQVTQGLGPGGLLTWTPIGASGRVWHGHQGRQGMQWQCSCWPGGSHCHQEEPLLEQSQPLPRGGLGQQPEKPPFCSVGPSAGPSATGATVAVLGSWCPDSCQGHQLKGPWDTQLLPAGEHLEREGRGLSARCVHTRQRPGRDTASH